MITVSRCHQMLEWGESKTNGTWPSAVVVVVVRELQCVSDGLMSLHDVTAVPRARQYLDRGWRQEHLH